MFERDPHPTVEEAVNVEISRPKREDGTKDLVIQVTIKRKFIITDNLNENTHQDKKKSTKKSS